MQLRTTETRGTMEGLALEPEESSNPFDAVIKDYEKRVTKAIRRNRTKAALVYAEAIVKIGQLCSQ